jgi:predicted HicB family RNase H-like nuclease
MGTPIPKPTRHGETAEPVRLMQRLPRSLHASLVARARAEGTSLNTPLPPGLRRPDRCFAAGI